MIEAQTLKKEIYLRYFTIHHYLSNYNITNLILEEKINLRPVFS